MRAARAEVLPSPARNRLLALLAALCLVAFGAPASASGYAAPGHGDAVVDAISQAPAMARALPERLHAGLLSPAKRQAPLAASLGALLLLTGLLVRLGAPGRVVGSARRGHLVASAGRGPPAHS